MYIAGFNTPPIHLLIKNQWRFTGALALVFAALIALVFFAKPTQYSATAVLLVEPGVKQVLGTDETIIFNSILSREAHEIRIQSQKVIMQFVADQNLVADPEFGYQRGVLDKIQSFFRLETNRPQSNTDKAAVVAEKVRHAIKFLPFVGPGLITVQMVSTNRLKAARLTNALLEAAINSRKKEFADLSTQHIVSLNRLVAVAFENAITSSQEEEGFRRSDLLSLVNPSNIPSVRKISGQIFAIRTQIESQSQLLKKVDQIIEKRNWDVEKNVLEGKAIEDLIVQRNKLFDQIKKAGAGSARAAVLKTDFEKLEDQLLQIVVIRQSELNGLLVVNKSQIKDLENQAIDELIDRGLPATLALRHQSLLKSTKSAIFQHNRLLKDLNAIKIIRDSTRSDLKILSKAVPQANLGWSQMMRGIMFAILGSMVVAMLAGWVRESLRNVIYSQEELQIITGLPVLPILNAMTNSIETIGAIDENDPINAPHMQPFSIISETVRQIDLSLEQISAGQKNSESKSATIIMVSSAIDQEDSSKIAVLLARTNALKGNRTLLIDLNLRNPQIHTMLGLQTKSGLLDHLREQTPNEANNMFATDEQTGLNLILGHGTCDVPPDQLLAGEKLRHLLEAAKQRFDTIILDVPAVIPHTDALHLIPQADVVVLVVRWANTSCNPVRDAVLRIKQFIRHDASAVTLLNRIDA
ncbi:MAG: hypothetical protein JKY49_10070 [Cohaesibacteraceae bacterium]|nr:hypothetical protein [Cohaesibacteraceae bacterium]